MNFPTNTTPEQEAVFAAIGHAKGLEALMAIPRPRRISLRTTDQGMVLKAPEKMFWAGILMWSILGGLGYVQWHTWTQAIENASIFHQFLWFVMGIGLLIAVPYTFVKTRLRFSPDRLVISRPVLGLGLPTTFFWEEIRSISKGAEMGMQGGVPVPGGRGGTTGAHAGVASTVKIKSIGGNGSFGKYLTEANRTYLGKAVTAYRAAWVAAVQIELDKARSIAVGA
jgi:hypothetical protein